jgi:SRSO17 transposase
MTLDKATLDLYSDYLISSLGGLTTATELSNLTNKLLSNDKVSRFLGGVYQEKGELKHTEYTSKDLWKLVKPIVRKHETTDSYLIIDDTIQEKQYSDENDVICWHFDHCFNRQVKGVNILNFILATPEINIPLALEVIKKTEKFTDIKDGKVIEKRRSKLTKNELLRDNFNQIIKNEVKFKWVLIDAWFGANETLEMINNAQKKYIVPLKSNRKIALSYKDKLQGKWLKLDTLDEITNQQIENNPTEVWLEGLDHKVHLIKQVFTNQDGTQGIQFLITNDYELSKDDTVSHYQKRWQVEEYHKSIKSNLGLAKSPTKTITTQINHFFCSVYSYLQLEFLTKSTKITNHFQLKSKLYLLALKKSFEELGNLRLEFGCER